MFFCKEDGCYSFAGWGMRNRGFHCAKHKTKGEMKSRKIRRIHCDPKNVLPPSTMSPHVGAGAHRVAFAI